MYNTKYLIIFIIAFFISHVSYAYRSGYADQRFLDNANQFVEEQGVRNSDFQRSMNNERSRLDYITPYAPATAPNSYPGVETQEKTHPKQSSKKSNNGISFSDMAKKTLKNKKRSFGYSFKDMAKSTKKTKTPTFNFKLKRNR